MGITVFNPPCNGGYDFPIDRTNTNLMCLADSYNSMQMNFQEHIMTPGYVENGIGDDFLRWNFKSPVLIDAPTGSGKTTFVCDKLIPMVYQRMGTLLLVSNRAALVRQQRQSVIDAIKICDKRITINPTEEEIDGFKFWGDVCVCTYHSLPFLLREAKINGRYGPFFSRLIYTVFDEAHYLYSDSTFSGSTQWLLECIPAYFYRTIRIYMTATSWSIANSLLKSERIVYFTMDKTYDKRQIIGNPYAINRRGDLPVCRFEHYKMEADYRNYRLNFFSGEDINTTTIDGLDRDLSALVNSIPSPNKKKKILIFVRRKADGIALEKMWKKKDVDVVFLDRSSKYGDNEEEQINEDEDDGDAEISEKARKHEAWNELLKTGKFDECVLISTSVLDCGVNITEPALKTVAIFADDPTTFLQMLGRRRMNPGDVVDVWAHISRTSQLSKIVQAKERELALAKELRFIRAFEEEYSSFQIGNEIQFQTEQNGQIYTTLRDDKQTTILIQHEKALTLRYPSDYPGSSYMGLYHKLWSQYGKISDKRLFSFDRFGRPTVNQYVYWVVDEQRRYYTDLLEEDMRMVIADWMGKRLETKGKWNVAIASLQTLLESYCECNVEEHQQRELREKIYKVGYECLLKNRPDRKWENKTPKKLTETVHNLGLPYTIERVEGSKSKAWRVFREYFNV